MFLKSCHQGGEMAAFEKVFERVLLLLLLAIFSVGCATSSMKNSVSGYQETFFNNPNKPPRWMEPPKNLFEKSEIINPIYMSSQADYHFMLGHLYSLKRKHTLARKEFQNALVYDNNSSNLRLRIASEYFAAGKITEAIEQSQEGLRIDPKNMELRLFLVVLYSSVRMFEPALLETQKVLEMDPKNLVAQQLLGILYAEKGQFAKAMKYLNQLMKQKEFQDYKEAHQVHYHAAQVYKDWGKSPKLVEYHLKKALDKKSNFAEAVFLLGRVYLEAKKISQAVKLLENYQANNASNGVIARTLYRLYLDDKKYDKAFKQLEVLDRKYPLDLSTKLKMALILIEKQDYQGALSQLFVIIKHAPDVDKALYYAAAVYEKIGEKKKAIEYYQKVPAVSSFYPRSIIHTVYLYNDQGQKQKALHTVEQALGKKTDVVEFYTLYASLLEEVKEYKKAMAILAKGVERFKKNAHLRFFQGFIHDKLGDKEASILSMKKVLELDKNHVQGLNYLAYTYAELDKNLLSAEKMALRAMSLKPNDGHVMDTYGFILYKRGKFKKAMKVLEKAHKVEPLEGVIAEHLADAYRRLNLVVQAEQMYIKAMEVEKDAEGIERIRQKLAIIKPSIRRAQRVPASVLEP